MTQTQSPTKSSPLLPVPTWAVATTFVLSLLGLGISLYLTIAHYTGAASISCPLGGGIINCAKVTTSPESHILGIPVAVLGLANYVVMSVINSPWGWHRSERWIAVARFVLTVAGMIFVLWLIAAELLIIKNLCLWCTGVHIVTFALLVVMTRVCPVQLGWSESRD